MKLFAVGALTVASLFAQKTDTPSTGYNVGVCAKDGGFIALHFDVKVDELDVTYVSPKAGEVDKLEPPMVFKKVFLGDRTTNYVAYVYEKDGKTEFDLMFDKGQVDGKVIYEDKNIDHVFGAQGAMNGLAADGMQLFDRCRAEQSK